ncbi:chymotrypsinogen A-like [Frankliniella occidentalis]|uniref:Chymotrypsinogen A-like n=1 Tax=Frankliniella occidentalis TaxID=133901 RepID=A0A9C6X8Q3_FRAOC|nr:chymotrypsinogen A-like [Frankliniella occidentalis]
MSTLAVLVPALLALAASASAATVPAGAAVLEVPLASDRGFPFSTAPMPLGVERVATPPRLQMVGGKDAALGQFPWQVSIQTLIPNTMWLKAVPWHICGGSLVAEGWVLTAAHCIWGVSQRSLRVDAVLGIANLKLQAEGAQRITVARMFAHAKYDHYARGGVGPNDIGMLKLARKAKLSETVKLVPINNVNGVDGEGTTTLSGWGSISQDGSRPVYPEQLQTADFPIVPHDKCIEALNNTEPAAVPLLADSNLCVGNVLGLASCSGDSGGPLVKEVDGVMVQIGVVSWGLTNCGSLPFPSVLTRVFSHVAWINAVQNKYKD